MKKIICILLILVLSASIFIACGNKDTGSAPVESSQSENVGDISPQENPESEVETIDLSRNIKRPNMPTEVRIYGKIVDG